MLKFEKIKTKDSMITLVDINSANTRIVDNDIFLISRVDNITSIIDRVRKAESIGIGLCLEGSGSICVNSATFELVPNRLFFILPEQFVGNIETSKNFKILFIAISADTLEDFSKENNIFSLFLQLKYIHYLDITDEERELFKEYHLFMSQFLKNKTDSYHKKSTSKLLESFFFEICHISKKHELLVSSLMGHQSRKESILQSFFKVLTQNYQSQRNVAFYANQLCLTAKHLSVVIKEASGRTVREWIDKFVILEAKALLNSSDMNIQEISDQLHFVNQSFFGKYFKHAVGVSPKKYREMGVPYYSENEH
ncbi:MAG: helix-turn-helix domain-containing protein [Bacteroides sp.]|jgi:AraC-like DNA-binding protein|nr:helix-turn-helix domain-containing protein [Bacteroides sp.]MCI1682739.1 helix-turn-helix domain-containing protein [Bacteroides sp.]